MQNKQQAHAAVLALQLDSAPSFGSAVQRAAASPLTSDARRITHTADGALITKNCAAHLTPTLSLVRDRQGRASHLYTPSPLVGR